MRETINDKTAENRSASIEINLTEYPNTDKHKQIGNDPNNYIYDGYKIHERFDPEGLPFADCIVRLFA